MEKEGGGNDCLTYMNAQIATRILEGMACHGVYWILGGGGVWLGQ